MFVLRRSPPESYCWLLHLAIVPVMHIERLNISGFRCFGAAECTVALQRDLTALIGVNGAGKTALLLALVRMFGVSGEQRRLRRQDFHVPAAELVPLAERSLYVEAIIAFPELDGQADLAAVPEFFQQMVADEQGRLKCRLRLQASWTDDGSLEGAVEQKLLAVRTFGAFTEDECFELRAADRAKIQMIYVPANRDGGSQVSAFLKGRLWRAINWSQGVKEVLASAGTAMNGAFVGETAVGRIAAAVTHRWQQMHSAGTDTTPVFRPVDVRWQEFVRKVEVMFHPDESGRERSLEDLSDGQRSLFHLAITAAILDVEAQAAADPTTAGFLEDSVSVPALTLIAVEEPENTLAPFYLSRIVGQILELTQGHRAQAIVSSHSASILARIEPEGVRHFRLSSADRTAVVRALQLPAGLEEASKFVREAVRSYPELYFARFVVLGEGATEEVVLPKLAASLGVPIDRSFVAIVPLGGRHVNHLWRLLTDLDIPHATLLDLDWGRSGGGWGRIKTTCLQLLECGVTPAQLFGDQLKPEGHQANLALFDQYAAANTPGCEAWMPWLRGFGVFFSAPLDLDCSMYKAFPAAYQVLEPGALGPSAKGEPRGAVLGEDGKHALYDATWDEAFRWYRYLFLGRGKPSTHVRVLSSLGAPQLAAGAPEELKALIGYVQAKLEPAGPGGA